MQSKGRSRVSKLMLCLITPCRCVYYYDAFGNLDQKNCSTGSFRYLVDPFGVFGGDIIAEVRQNRTLIIPH